MLLAVERCLFVKQISDDGRRKNVALPCCIAYNCWDSYRVSRTPRSKYILHLFLIASVTPQSFRWFSHWSYWLDFAQGANVYRYTTLSERRCVTNISLLNPDRCHKPRGSRQFPERKLELGPPIETLTPLPQYWPCRRWGPCLLKLR